MSDGADDSLCSPEFIPDEDEGEDIGRGVSVETGSNRAGNSLLSDTPSNSLGLTSEWDTYIDSQIRDSWSDLKHDEQAFCDEFLDNGYKHREAALTIERSADSGIRLLNKPLCREYIHFHEQKRRARRIVSERFFDAQLADLYDQAIGDVEVPLVTGSGIELTAKKFNGPLALGIIQERGKLSGVTKPDAPDNQINVIIDVGALTGKVKEIN